MQNKKAILTVLMLSGALTFATAPSIAQERPSGTGSGTGSGKGSGGSSPSGLGSGSGSESQKGSSDLPSDTDPSKAQKSKRKSTEEPASGTTGESGSKSREGGSMPKGKSE
jgi:hypothetical protein